jgi:hypothetical protein
MPQPLSDALLEAVANGHRELLTITEERGGEKRPQRGWTRKQELGHLIDSASNNHIRFVRASLEGELDGPSYDQNGWVDLHDHGEQRWQALVEFWRAYNLLLARVVARIPEDRLDAKCIIGGAAPVTLGFVITDYVRHLRHHIDQIAR